MADVAARVGVSKMTVSRALRSEGRSARSDSRALYERILKASCEMGYALNQTAHTFSSKRSGFVAALVPALNNSKLSDTAHGLTAAVEASGLQVLLGHTNDNAHTEACGPVCRAATTGFAVNQTRTGRARICSVRCR